MRRDLLEIQRTQCFMHKRKNGTKLYFGEKWAQQSKQMSTVVNIGAEISNELNSHEKVVGEGMSIGKIRGAAFFYF